MRATAEQTLLETKLCWIAVPTHSPLNSAATWNFNVLKNYTLFVFSSAWRYCRVTEIQSLVCAVPGSDVRRVSVSVFTTDVFSLLLLTENNRRPCRKAEKIFLVNRIWCDHQLALYSTDFWPDFLCADKLYVFHLGQYVFIVSLTWSLWWKRRLMCYDYRKTVQGDVTQY